ncbi:MAG: hypothetical protein NTY02_13630 [Acidobacteria bacterium]|nr:hypothetical protein [Acidobacteriota bacterium]
MRFSRLAVAAISVVVPLLVHAQTGPVTTALDALRRGREAVARAFPLDREHARLDGYVRTIEHALARPDLLQQPPLDRLPFAPDDRVEFLRRISALAAERLGLRLEAISVGFARLDRPTAGRVRIFGERASVEIADRHRDDDDEILMIAAHEFAHIRLEAPGAGIANAGDEDLVDATVVMVGLGPLVLRASYREWLSTAGGRATWGVHRTGSLHPVAIAYLTLVQAERAGVGEEARRRLLGNWLEPAWSFRVRHPDAGRILPSGEGLPAAITR